MLYPSRLLHVFHVHPPSCTGGWDAFPGSSASLLIVTQLTAEQDLRQEIFDLLTLENMHEED